MSDDEVNYCKCIMIIKFKTSDDLIFNEIINILVCLTVTSSVFKENDDYYPQFLSHDSFYEYDVNPLE